jgi:hypothetical protein
MLHLPTELWQVVFEQLYVHDVHIFRQSAHCRRNTIRHLQRLQLVCRKWRVCICRAILEPVQQLTNKQDMIRPLTYRHPAFEGWTQDDSNQIVQFVESLDRIGYEFSPKSTWIHSLWL